MEQPKTSNAAKYAFYYLLSLVSLIFMALSSGMVVFQIINKKIADSLSIYGTDYSPEALKFAISAIIIATPIYFVTTYVINKNLFDGKLERESGVRKWLTYFILLISCVVMIGWLIGTVFNYLDGELTKKFILKAITSLFISAAVFSYYLYDIWRPSVIGAKDKIIKIYFFGSLALVVIVLVSAFFYVESPAETRNKKHDNVILNRMDMIDNAMNDYYSATKKLPSSLGELASKSQIITSKDIIDPSTDKNIEYKVKAKNKYELCAEFKTSNKDTGDRSYEWLNNRWPHDSGRQCITRELLDKTVDTTTDNPEAATKVKNVPVPTVKKK